MATVVTQKAVRDAEIVVPIAERPAEEARLSFDDGLEQVDLRAGDDPEALLTARFGEPLPSVWAAGGTVHIGYPMGSRLLRRVHPNTIRLNPGVPWALDVHGGTSGLEADLTGVDVRSVAFHSGAANVRLVLGRPDSPRPIRLASLKRVRIERPAGVPVRLELAGGATNVTLDDKRFGAIGRGLTDHTDGYDPTAPHYLVTVAGGADTLTIVTTT
ncbi:MAG TPA: hypothetical protein VIL37_19390 [Natronosporangium sp.]